MAFCDWTHSWLSYLIIVCNHSWVRGVWFIHLPCNLQKIDVCVCLFVWFALGTFFRLVLEVQMMLKWRTAIRRRRRTRRRCRSSDWCVVRSDCCTLDTSSWVCSGSVNFCKFNFGIWNIWFQALESMGVWVSVREVLDRPEICCWMAHAVKLHVWPRWPAWGVSVVSGPLWSVWAWEGFWRKVWRRYLELESKSVWTCFKSESLYCAHAFV